jgi:hypothetical protein
LAAGQVKEVSVVNIHIILFPHEEERVVAIIAI